MSGYVERLRACLGPRKVILVYTTALIREAGGRLLFQRRADFEWWGLPGGVLEVGESLADGVVREVREAKFPARRREALLCALDWHDEVCGLWLPLRVDPGE